MFPVDTHHTTSLNYIRFTSVLNFYIIVFSYLQVLKDVLIIYSEMLKTSYFPISNSIVKSYNPHVDPIFEPWVRHSWFEVFVMSYPSPYILIFFHFQLSCYTIPNNCKLDNAQIYNKEKTFTCHTPTIALAIRMRRMTKGSTNAVMVPSPSSNHARVYRTEKRER